MKRKFTGIAILAALGVLLLSLANCGRDQELVGILIQPGAETVGATDTPVIDNAGAQTQLTALGSYIHPPVTKDITNQVTWVSNTPQMFTVDSTGLLTATGQSCGSTLVSATVTTNKSAGGISSSGAIVVGYMTASVVCFTGSGSGAGPAITVSFAGTGSGTVSSSPTGLICTSPNPCVDSFPAGTALTLTATPTPPSTTGSWQGTCPTTTATDVCTFTVEENTTLTASFN
jgi:hypothetical protein